MSPKTLSCAVCHVRAIRYHEVTSKFHAQTLKFPRGAQYVRLAGRSASQPDLTQPASGLPRTAQRKPTHFDRNTLGTHVMHPPLSSHASHSDLHHIRLIHVGNVLGKWQRYFSISALNFADPCLFCKRSKKHAA
jgi:hypothetical protein